MNPHHQQTNDHSHVAHCIGKKAPAFADLRHQNPRNGRPDHARAVEHGRVQRDRIHQIFLANHIHQKRLPPRNVKGVHYAQQARQHKHVPDLDFMEQRERSQNEGQRHRRHLRRNHNMAAVHAISRNSA